ncbi:MAG: hypothetical protein AAF039_15675, partial [Bacteroidota bacterium]
MKKILSTLLFLLITGLVSSQTTVTLQDQCNCEVLSGTDVSTPGSTTPTGADTGDIYVNTNTGEIFFWDGDSWELTSSDNQQLTGFTFNDTTNLLTLDLENGGSVNVDLSALSDTLSDTNTTITSFAIDAGTNSLVITDSDTNTFSVLLADLAAAIDTDNQDLSLNIGTNELSLTNDATPVDLSPYVNDDTNELTDLSLTGSTLTLTNPATGGNSVTLPSADGTETVVNAGTDISVTGDGSAGDPYVVSNTFTEVDGSITNELTDLSLTGSTLT